MDLLNNEMEEGIIILVVGMGVVFLSLILLHVVFTFIVPKILALGAPASKTKTPEKPEAKSKEHRSGEEMAAIAAAVYMFLEEAHDEENAILTIGKSSKSYSPWSSKIYVTHNLARR